MHTKEIHGTVRFGPYEADFEEGTLRKNGRALKVQGKPLAVLQVLVENAGRVVSREELRRSLWPDNTFVDFDKNLSTAVNKLREALCDSAGEAQYVETVRRKGYRFCATVEYAEPEEAPETLPVPAGKTRSRAGRTIWVSTGVVLLVAMIALGFSLNARRGTALTEKDFVVLGDFDNRTGDQVFDHTLKTALVVSLRQSPFLNIWPDRQMRATLKLMNRPPDAKLTPDLARELCQRAGGGAYISEAIGSLGSEYVLELKAADCRNGRLLAREQVTADNKDKVIEVLGNAAMRLRSELGESLATLRRFDVPLEQATTSSLEALEAYSLAEKAAHESGAEQSLPYVQRAIELDPNFAMAYEAAGVHYFNLNEPARAGEYLARAFQLRDHASERERIKITASYYGSVTGELAKAAAAYQEAIAEYPRDVAGYNNLGIIFAEQGNYSEAVEITRKGTEIAPNEITLDENLAGYLIAVERYQEAQQLIREDQPRKPDNYVFPSDLYGLAFLSSDKEAMSAEQKWFQGKPEYENQGLALASDSEAFFGRLRSARELTRRAVESAIHSDRKETGAIWLAIAAQREAAFGFALDARQSATQALSLAPKSKGVEAEAAFAYALAKDDSRVQPLIKDLTTRYPLDTQIESLWLPAIRAQLDLNHGRTGEAIKELEGVPSPDEFGAIIFGANGGGSCLYTTYVRAEAYRAAGQGKAAAAEYQKILDHRGVVWNCWTGAVAQLDSARATAVEARSGKGVDRDAARVRALAAYGGFLGVWKDADADNPLLMQARLEYTSLEKQ